MAALSKGDSRKDRVGSAGESWGVDNAGARWCAGVLVCECAVKLEWMKLGDRLLQRTDATILAATPHCTVLYSMVLQLHCAAHRVHKYVTELRG